MLYYYTISCGKVKQLNTRFCIKKTYRLFFKLFIKNLILSSFLKKFIHKINFFPFKNFIDKFFNKKLRPKAKFLRGIFSDFLG